MPTSGPGSTRWGAQHASAFARFAALVLFLVTLTASPAAAGFGPGSGIPLQPDRAADINGHQVLDAGRPMSISTSRPVISGVTAPDIRVVVRAGRPGAAADLVQRVGATVSQPDGSYIVAVTEALPSGVSELWLTLEDAAGNVTEPGLLATVDAPAPTDAHVAPPTDVQPPPPSLRGSNYLTASIAVGASIAALALAYVIVRRRSARMPGAMRPLAIGPTRSLAGGRVRLALIAATGLAVALRLLLAGPIIHDWDGYVFIETAENLLAGETPYQTVETNDPSIYPTSDRAYGQQWYAYPPLPMGMFTSTYAAVKVTGIEMTPTVVNVAIKASFIAGDVIAAWLLGLVVVRSGTRRSNGVRALLLLLFNPLFIFISGGWGMFDSWMLVFLLAFVLLVQHRRFPEAGVALALAPLVKLFPVVFLPMCAAFVWHRSGRDRRATGQCAAAFAATIGVVVAPFLIASPRGFINQMVLMHMTRAPQGVGLSGIADQLGFIYQRDVAIFADVLSLITLLVIGLLVAWGVATVKDSEHRLFASMALVYAAAMVGNKVVNEQYFVLMIGLLIAMSHLPRAGRGLPHRVFSYWHLRRLEVLTTACSVFAALVVGFHFLTMIESSIAEGSLGGSTHQLVYYLGGLTTFVPTHSPSDTVFTYYNAVQVIAYLPMVLLAGLLARFVYAGLRVAFAERQDVARTWRAFFRAWDLARVAHVAKPAFGAFLVVTMVAGPLSWRMRDAGALDPIELGGSDAAFSGGPQVGTFYYLWWNNPAHDPSERGDVWNLTAETPELGYYSSKISIYAEHIRQMREVGIDFAMVSYHLYDRGRFRTFSEYADEVGFGYVPLIETNDAFKERQYKAIDPLDATTLSYRVSDESSEWLADVTVSAVPRAGAGDGWMRIDGRPVIAIYDGHFFIPSWDAASKRDLASRIVARYGERQDPYLAISEAWGQTVTGLDDVLAAHPTDVPGFRDATPAARDYRTAFEEAYAQYWTEFRRDVESRLGPVYLMSTYPTPLPRADIAVLDTADLERLGLFDNDFYYSLSNTWTAWRGDALPAEIFEVWSDQVDDHAARARSRSDAWFATVSGAYDDRVIRREAGFTIPEEINGRRIYDFTWQTALGHEPDFVLISSWNEFFEGSAIEPTLSNGGRLLRATERWIDRLGVRPRVIPEGFDDAGEAVELP